MSAAYRVSRAVLAVTGAITVAAFIGWHVLVWRMGEIYRWDNRSGR